jgi:type IV pilus assembly protein PilM
VRSGELQDLPASINRLLELQPGHEMATRLARQLRERLVATAKKKLAADEFDAALRVLEKIPESEQDEEVEAVRDRGRELEWLLQDIKLAPAVDEPLVALAERLVKLRPEHAEATELLKKMRVRFREPPADRRHSAPAWALPRQTRFGFPVHGLAGLQRILRSSEMDARLRQTPGRWSVACGLALQALDQAAVPINLAPAKEAGLLTKLPFLRRKAATSAWGLDLGATGLKAVRLTLEPQQAAVTLDAVERLDFPGPFTQLADAVERRRLQVETLRQFVQRHALAGERVGVSVSGRQVLGRFVELPTIEPKRLDDLVRHEASVQYPVDLQELAWGYHVLPRPAGDQSESPSRRVVMQAVKRHHVQELLSLYQDAGLSVDVVQSDSLALHNFAIYEFFGGSEGNGASSSVVALLDLGAESANLVFSSPHLVWFRNLAVAGESFTNALLRPLKLTREQAEQLKREPARARRVYCLYELWDPMLTYLADEVERSLDTCKRQFPELEVQQMFGLGGGFQLHGVLRRLTGQ